MRIVRWDGWVQPLTQEIVSVLRDSIDASLETMRAQNPDMAATVLNWLFEPTLLPTVLPGVGTAMLDEEGWIWVARYRPSTELWHEEDAWHVLDPEGTPVARVRLPSKARLAAVRQDRVAVVVRDSLDVDQVHVLAIER
jgi:hypothetical protein